MDFMEIHIGCWVSLRLSSSNTPIIGTVRFLGETDFAEGSWLGLVLIEECRKYAKNNGTVKGKNYFTLSEETEDPSSDFGLFVRPQTVQLLSAEDLISLPDISSKTKIHLLYSNIESLKSKLIDYSEKLETTQVEYEYLQSETLSLRQQLDDLILNNQVLRSSLADDINVDTDLSLTNKKLELSIAQLKEEFHNREYEYLETIELLQRDFQSLEKKLTNSNDSKILSDLNSSELIVEKLTSENSELLSKIDEMNGKISELEKIIKLNNDLNSCYEQTEKELNDLINNLKLKLAEKDDELTIYKANLDNVNTIISLHANKESTDNHFKGLYKRILFSFNSSSVEYSNFLLDKFIPIEFKSILQFIKSVYKLKYSATTILEFCPNDSIEYTNWSTLRSKLEFILQLVNYDTDYFLEYQEYIETINSFIMHCIESNNENDAPILLSMSLDLPLDVKSFFNTSFEPQLINREVLLYYADQHSELYTKLVNLRSLNRGIQLQDESFLECITNNNFEMINFTIVYLIKTQFWQVQKQEQVEPVPTVNTELYEELELKIKILQSKLLDEKKVQQEISQLEKKTRDHEMNESDLKSQLDKALENDNQLNLQIDNLQKILDKYGIKDNKLNDEFDILEKHKLLNTIEKQRSLITKLTESSFEKDSKLKQYDYELDSYSFTPVKLSPSIPLTYYRRIDRLFDLCNNPISDSPHNHSYNHQQILEYLDMY